MKIRENFWSWIITDGKSDDDIVWGPVLPQNCHLWFLKLIISEQYIPIKNCSEQNNANGFKIGPTLVFQNWSVPDNDQVISMEWLTSYHFVNACIEDVFLWPDFGNSSIYMKKMIITSIL